MDDYGDKYRNSGIDVIGGIPWGTHLCHFYQTKQDLIDVLVPYFKSGLGDNEFCMWITSDPLEEKQAINALKQTVPDIAHFIENGQIEIMSYDRWYLDNGKFEYNRVLTGWISKLERATEKGFDGLRLTGNTFWLTRDDWNEFSKYERAVDKIIGKQKMLALCSYSLAECDSSAIIDVVQNHQLALIKREGRWQTIESSSYKQTKEQLNREHARAKTLAKILEKERDSLQAIMDNTETCLAYLDRNFNFIKINSSYERLSGHTKEELIGNYHFAFFPDPENEAIFIKARDTGEPVEFKAKPFRYTDQPWRGVTYWDWTLTPVKNYLNEVESFVFSLIDVTDTIRSKQLSDALNHINAEINSTLHFDEIIDRVTAKALEEMRAETAGIVLQRNGRWVISHLCGVLYERAADIVGKPLTEDQAKAVTPAAGSADPIVRNDTYNDPTIDQKLVREHEVRSILCLPLIIRDKVIGNINFIYHSEAVHFSNIQIEFGRKLATSLSLALQNSRLYEEQRTVSEALQQSLLTIPEKVEGIKLGHFYHSSTLISKVGGDFYDLFELDDHRIGIVVGDVSGKGLQAANVTSLVKNTIRAYAQENELPSVILHKTNCLVRKLMRPEMFTTLFLGILNKFTGSLLYCGAGHPHSFLSRSSYGVETLYTNSPALGIFSGIKFIDNKKTLQNSDILVVYTDGITEARKNAEFYGEERLIELIERSAQVGAENICNHIFNEVNDFSGGNLSDDIAILAVSPISIPDRTVFHKIKPLYLRSSI